MVIKVLNIGFGNIVSAARVVAVISPSSAPMKRLKEEARERGKLVDATEGRMTRSVIITDSDHVILSALQTERLAERLAEGKVADA
ncbi:MAG: DUF370 domain-containing protein [Deltaproteobacteria bacterium]|nr:DUF370 domain-containing protein [Deltaproteobacteria bacterium]